ncbi:AsmA2 domain-containing protein YhdP [Limnobaculum parvum]|uniref:AsmA2 domain-containing protein n=1 Tax=Limnobaculum parvum TaxID=2172103 RepID=A0A2Y9TYH0_9GAMM|nr:AsmA2 domain-containing protein YhdP [Limnobaculum parvum]AWH88424.1 AsmA2 domain-containing protein [Limnobaculum parvum]
MRRTSRMLFKIVILLLVLLTLVVGGLRFALPRINEYRQPILDTVNRFTGIPAQVEQMEGKWEMFGPALDLRNISLETSAGKIDISRVTVALDVWESLLHFRFQFRDLTFYQVNGNLDYMVGQSKESEGASDLTTLENIFLEQFDHFILRDSKLSFLALSGDRVTVELPRLTWLNSRNRHRAEGHVQVSTENGPRGLLEVRLDLRDEEGLLDSGTVYLQADSVNMLPWLSHWFKSNSGFDNAQFSLASWLYIKKGVIDGGDVLLSQGRANWHNDENMHQLDVNQLSVHLSQQEKGWRLDVPSLNLKTDGVVWPAGRVSLFWQPEGMTSGGDKWEEQLRIRAENLSLDHINPLLPIFSFLTPDALDIWFKMDPHGNLPLLALDIPLKQPEKTRFQAEWREARWQPWELIPGSDHTQGTIAGSTSEGTMSITLNNSTLPYSSVFRAPLEVSKANATLNWLNNQNEFRLWSDHIDVQAKSLWANGGFDYLQPEGSDPWLSILAGIRVYDAGNAWRYFPEPLMGTNLVNYLSSAIIAGKSDNATLIFSGNPHKFPYPEKDGLFEVYAPLTETTFKFQPDWMPLTDMTIDLDFINAGLWMNAPTAKLGKVNGHNIEAIIADYAKHQLAITAEVEGDGADVRDYMNGSPLKSSVGAALEQVDVGGNVSGRLQLDIPLDGKNALAKGDITLKGNSLYIKPIDSTMENVSGTFSFDNGDLISKPLTAQWFNQPVGLNFSTKQNAKDYGVKVGITGNWSVANLPWLPKEIASEVAGNASWKSDVAITLPPKGSAKYDVLFTGDLKGVSSRLPAPLNKSSGSVLPVKLKASGDLKGFSMDGTIAGNQAINSQWVFTKDQTKLTRLAWQMNSQKIPALSSDDRLDMQLPALDGEKLMAALGSLSLAETSGKTGKFAMPPRWIFRSPQVELAGQYWRDVAVDVDNRSANTEVGIKGKEIDARLSIRNNQPWRADIDYLYFNPKKEILLGSITDNRGKAGKSSLPSIDFGRLPSIGIRCKECWGMGQRLGIVEADVRFRSESLSLSNGVIDTGSTRLTFNGDWLQSPAGSATRVDGQLSGQKIDRSMDYFGVYTPLKDAPFDVNFSLAWQGEPWAPQVDTLDGQLATHLGKGLVDNAGGGHAGQILRLLSFNALMRKLQFDFSDTFGNGFYFDTINGSIKLTKGVATTNDTLVDGLSADIAIDGSIDLAKQHLNLDAVVAPEMSATVGVATAFVVNPIAGAAVFTVSQVLAPLWNKISLIRYKIDGSLENPNVNEVLRQPKGEDH